MTKKGIKKKQKDTWSGASDEQREIMAFYERLKSCLPPSTSTQELDKIEEAFQLALSAHAGIRRRSGEPYIIHPLRVALIVAQEIGLGTTSILSAIIHDVVEDTSVSINEVRALFGLEVYQIVKGLTKIKRIFSENQSKQAENFKKLFLNASEDNRIILIKIADRLDNMRYISALPRRKQLRTAAETQQIYAPVANRLGLNRIKAELEDLYLKCTHPEAYYKIAEKLAATLKERAEKLTVFSQAIQKILKERKIKFKIKNRVKSIYSIWNKMQKNKTPFKEIYDLIGLRLILDCPDEDEKALCWQTYGYISNTFTSNSSRLRDWISNPKSNGYEALHITVMSPFSEWVEIQIRTTRTHEIAKRGVAAHWEYKKDMALGQGAKRLEKWLLQIRKLLEEGNFDSLTIMKDIQLSLYDDEICVFNTKGNATVLPQGATVLDLAIEVLAEKGLTCSGAMINERFVPVHYILKNGEQVELMLTQGQNIPQHWIDIPRTATARRAIKNFFKREYLSILQKGRKTMRTELKKRSLTMNKKTEAFLRDLFNEKTMEKTYHNIGTETISVKTLRKAIAILADINHHKPGTIQKNTALSLKLEVEKDIIVTLGHDPQYKLASCCSPIPDEEIFGVKTVDQEMKIHRVDCPKAAEILSMQGRSIVKARWKHSAKDSFLVSLTLKAANRQGMTKEIVNAIKASVHIEALSFLEQAEYIKGNLSIEVENAKQLDKVIGKLGAIKGIVGIERAYS